MSLLNDELLQAMDLALAGRWDEAHQVVQHYEDNPMASWIHAVLHQQEGDLGHSRYWYRQAGRLDRVGADPQVELAAIRVELLAGRGLDGPGYCFNLGDAQRNQMPATILRRKSPGSTGF